MEKLQIASSPCCRGIGLETLFSLNRMIHLDTNRHIHPDRLHQHTPKRVLEYQGHPSGGPSIRDCYPYKVGWRMVSNHSGATTIEGKYKKYSRSTDIDFHQIENLFQDDNPSVNLSQYLCFNL